MALCHGPGSSDLRGGVRAAGPWAGASCACDQAGDDSPSAGYAIVYPVAMVLKILVAQLLVMFLT